MKTPVSILGFMGDIPVVASPDQRSFKALYQFEWRVFKQKPALRCFIRTALDFECKPKPSAEPIKCYLLIRRVSPRCWFRVFFCQPAGATFESAAQKVEKIQQDISSHAFELTSQKGELPYE